MHYPGFTYGLNDLELLFVPRRSASGSNAAAVEARVIGFWRDLLLDVEEQNDADEEIAQSF